MSDETDYLAAVRHCMRIASERGDLATVEAAWKILAVPPERTAAQERALIVAWLRGRDKPGNLTVKEVMRRDMADAIAGCVHEEDDDALIPF